MDKRKAIEFLYAIAKEIKRSFESPAILLTMKDYADCIYKSLVDMRTALLQNADPEQVVKIISNFHQEWLQAIQDVEDFKGRFRDMPREVIIKALEFTKECCTNRRTYFQKYIDEIQSTITTVESNILRIDLDTMEEINITVNSVLDEKQKYFLFQVDQTEYCIRVVDEIEELLNWLDKLNDHLAVEFSKSLGLRHTELLGDLTKTLRDIIQEISASGDSDEQKIAEEMDTKRIQLRCAIRLNENTDFEISKLLEKIKVLESRIDRLKKEDSSAIMALQHKSLYLEEKLQAMENLKLSLFKLKQRQLEKSSSHNLSEQTDVHIFDHLLPVQERKRLVEQLVNLWNDAILSVQQKQSIISILSATDINEVYRDELGLFTVDKYGRKLYKVKNDATVYQVNNHNQLVEVSDDEDHVYFYDDCGRYYLSKEKERIYKAHGSASEYIIDNNGKMMKLKEEREGKVFWYDHLGRYQIDENGKNIYSEEFSDEKYEGDGLGNIIRIRSEESIAYVPCPREPAVTEENKYLQNVVGAALKKCLADIVVRQPQDPIKYLAEGLEKYRYMMQMREKRLQDPQAMMAERKLHIQTSTPDNAYLNGCEGYTKCRDLNFINYETPKDF